MDPVLTPSVILLLGFLVPFVVSAIKSERLPDWAKLGLVLVVCVGCAVASAGALTTLTVESVLSYATSIFTIATFVYKTKFKDSGINERLTKFIWG